MFKKVLSTLSLITFTLGFAYPWAGASYSPQYAIPVTCSVTLIGAAITMSISHTAPVGIARDITVVTVTGTAKADNYVQAVSVDYYTDANTALFTLKVDSQTFGSNISTYVFRFDIPVTVKAGTVPPTHIV